ncbi:MAG: chemotaxis response regulator protein-glutamate methylesterase [Terracidiphilus sp.]
MAPSRRVRILIVDDSAVMRSILRSVLRMQAGFEVVGTAVDGETALGAVEALHPDLVLLDVEMPVMDGLATLRKLRGRGHRMPVIMCSSLTQRGGRVTIEALASGASDYVAKPASQAGPAESMRSLARELLPKIAALTALPPASSALANSMRAMQGPGAPQLPGTEPIVSIPSLLAIGISTGGPAALDIVLPAFPATFPIPVLIVQHMPELFTRLLAERLNGRCPLAVREAAEGNPVQPGTIYIARGDWHLEIVSPLRTGQPPTLHLTQAPPENHCRPSVDVLYRSAAAVYGSGVLAAVLTGMGSDGMAGARIVRARGGTVLAQDQATSAVWGMPGAVVRQGLAQRVFPLQAIAPEIMRLTARSPRDAKELREAVAL